MTGVQTCALPICLHLDPRLGAGLEIALTEPQSHYLRNVLRLSPGDPVRAFNGHDGEWLCYLADGGKRQARLRCERPTAAAAPPPDIDYLFAPLKHARLDYVVQKATELGARRLRPVITTRTIAQRVNLERMRANAIEAAEQCGVLSIPDIAEPMTFGRMLGARNPDRLLVFCDEDADVKNPITALSDARPKPEASLPLAVQNAAQPIAVLIGPEGGFADEERAALLQQPNIVRLSLGPRILRADTAAVAALALVQAVLGDWKA